MEQLYQPGQFFWAPALFLFGEKPVYLIKGKYIKATREIDYRIETMQDDEFSHIEEPIITMKVESDERAAIVRCKLRPVILLSTHPDKWRDGYRTYDEAYLIAPVYSFQGNGGKTDYSPVFIERIKAFVYNTFFYLPPSRSPSFSEGFIHLDRIQVIHKDQLRHMPVMLGEDALWLLQSWLYHYSGGNLAEVNEVLNDYRAEAIKVLKGAGLL